MKLAAEGKISPQEWLVWVTKCPNVISNMTLPALKEITTAYPSFAFHSVASQHELGGQAE